MTRICKVSYPHWFLVDFKADKTFFVSSIPFYVQQHLYGAIHILLLPSSSLCCPKACLYLQGDHWTHYVLPAGTGSTAQQCDLKRYPGISHFDVITYFVYAKFILRKILCSLHLLWHGFSFWYHMLDFFLLMWLVTLKQVCFFNVWPPSGANEFSQILSLVENSFSLAGKSSSLLKKSINFLV